MTGFGSPRVILSKPHETATDKSTKVADRVLGNSGLAQLTKTSLRSTMYKRECAAYKKKKAQEAIEQETPAMVFLKN